MKILKKEYFYHLYGLSIRSNQDIKQLVPGNTRKEADVNLHFHQKKTKRAYDFKAEAKEIYNSYGLAENGIPYLTIWKQSNFEEEFLIIRYSNGTVIAFFLSDKTGKNVTVYFPEELPYGDVLTYFTGPVIGCILRLKNKVCLHASVVNIHDKAIAFIGEKGAGKSTLIASLAALGYPVLTDDIAVLFSKNDQYFVHTGYPRLRLWKSSIDHFEGAKQERFERVLSFSEKYYLPLSLHKTSAWNFQNQLLPLDSVYYLKARNTEDVLSIGEYAPLAGFVKLKQNIYAEYMLDEELKRKEFEVLGEIANTKTIKYLDRPDDLSTLRQLGKMVVEDVNSNEV